MAKQREIHDHYFHEAKRQGYRSRAAFKLTEIDDRRKILRKGRYVLDCGAAPGAWLQVAAQRVGRKGVVVGIDLKAIEAGFRESNIVTVEGDLREHPIDDLLEPCGGALFDVVLSDMAPSTTGDRIMDHHGSIRLCHAVLDRCPDLLKPGGDLVMKAFEGEAYRDLLERTRRGFETVKGFSPKASRSDSTEMYVTAMTFRGGAIPAATDDTDDADERQLPKRRPSTGWS